MVDDDTHRGPSHKDIIRRLICNQSHVIPSRVLYGRMVNGDFNKALILFPQIAQKISQTADSLCNRRINKKNLAE